ncbi:MAG: hypothetical protein OXI24_13785, partial [Candidatus Poribacteria bacterium]|nr:hypothetical protein [Candidatus Poribacteria bacterium]
MLNISTLLKSILLLAILFIAFYIRIQGRTDIPEGHFTGVDAYIYYFQAQQISEQGRLPVRDMQRWLPIGRDNRQLLSLYSYALAYSHKIVVRAFPNITLYDVAFYMPVFCFCVGLGGLCLFLSRTFGVLFSILVGVLLTTLPGAINRSTAGFGDRDAWCWMLGLLAVITYLMALQAETPRKRLIWTLTSGFLVFLGGMSWEGFGVFLSVILVVEVWRFLTSEAENNLGLYLLWLICFVPTLYLVSPAYRNGYGFAEHLFAFMLVPPIVLLGIRTLRHLLLVLVEKLQPHARTLALVLTVTSIAGAVSYVLMQLGTFAETTVPLSQNAVMQSVGELRNTNSQYWQVRYGYVFVLSCVGVMIAAMHQWKNYSALLLLPLTVFILTTFFREYTDNLWGIQQNNIFFLSTIAATAIMLMFMGWRRDFNPKNELVYVAAIAWFLIWISLSRDAERYSNFSSPIIAFFAVELIQFGSVKFSEAFNRYLPWRVVKIAIAMILLATCLWPPYPLGYAQNILPATHARSSKPTDRTVAETFQWMKAELPNTAVVAADWIHGSQLNVLGGVKTITGTDTFIQHWIHLYYRYLFCGDSEKEALEFLKSHEVTHLMLTEKDVVKSAVNNSSIGARSERDKPFEIIELRKAIQEKEDIFVFSAKRTSLFNNIQIYIDPENKNSIKAFAIGKSGSVRKLPFVVFRDKERNIYENQMGSKMGGIILYFNELQQYEKGYYIPSVAWDNFAIRLFLRGIPSKAFQPVFAAEDTHATGVKVWKIHYPPDIRLHRKY